MTHNIHKLSALAIKKASKPGYYGDGGGLWLQVSKSGSKSWVFRFTRHGRAREMGLGSFNTFSLSEAREKALKCRKTLAYGKDPIEERKAQLQQETIKNHKNKTFAECALEFIEVNKAGWRSPKHAKQWESTLQTYAFPTIGNLPVSEIDTGLILGMLQQNTSKGDETGNLWQLKTETASRVRGRVESVLDWAKVRGYREGENPARWKGHLDKLLPARSKVQKTEHFAALPYQEISDFMQELRKRKGLSARALEFSILCASRSGEIREARWTEIDLDERLWTIPAERMKAGKEHRIPLSTTATKLLQKLPFLPDCDYVFPSEHGGPLSNGAMMSLLKRMGRNDLTQHGFRSTFRDWAGETTGYPREVIEHALAHQLKDKSEAAYQRGDLLTKRARLMEDWGKYCNS